MARLTSVMLCDFAQVRENLLFVSSAGINRLFQPATPIHPPLFLAGIVEISAGELEWEHQVRVRIRWADRADELGEAVLTMQVGSTEQMRPGESAIMPFALPLGALELPEFGTYDISVQVDDEESVVLTLYVDRIELPAT